jgi:FdhD protein
MVIVHDASTYLRYQGEQCEIEHKRMIGEAACSLVVNGEKWVTFLCTPTDVEPLVIGFLFNAGVIDSIGEVEEIKVLGGDDDLQIMAEVRLDHGALLPSRPVLTSGCGGGITFWDIAAARSPITSECRVTPAQVYNSMKLLLTLNSDLHRDVGGFHSAALSDGERLLLTAHDVGRHNTLDRIAGASLATGISTRGCLLVSTGRISTEMLAKAARMETPIVVSRNSPTGLATHLARSWNVTLVGYVRGHSMHVYTVPERIGS